MWRSSSSLGYKKILQTTDINWKKDIIYVVDIPEKDIEKTQKIYQNYL